MAAPDKVARGKETSDRLRSLVFFMSAGEEGYSFTSFKAAEFMQ